MLVKHSVPLSLLLCSFFVFINCKLLSLTNTTTYKHISDYHYDNQVVKLGYPHYFVFRNGQFLNMIITFENVASNVDILLSHNAGLNVQPIEMAKLKAKSFLCSGNLYFHWIWVHVKLQTNSTVCEIKNITEGINVAMTRAISYEAKYKNFTFLNNESCFNTLPCIIEVDLKNKCGETGRESDFKYETENRPVVTPTTILSTTTLRTTTSSATTYTDIDESTDHSLIIISTVAVVIVIVTVMILISLKKRCWTKSDPPPRPQLPINNDVFYLNLLFRRECDQEIEEAEHFYEEIE